jgi:hypothetical protein
MVFTAPAIAGYGIAASLIGTAAAAREAQLSQKAAKEAEVPNIAAPQVPVGAQQATANQVQAANLQAQTAGATLLSSPQNPNRAGTPGTVPGNAKSLLGG